MKDYLQYVILLTLGLIAAANIYFVYLFFEPFKVPQLYTDPFLVLNENKEVKRGEKLNYYVEFEKFENVSVTSFNNIICKDGNLVTLASETTGTALPIGRHNVNLSIIVPEKTSKGECRLVIEVFYHVNLFKEIKATRYTEWFMVI